MSQYQKWLDEHRAKVEAVIQKHKLDGEDEINLFFEYDNLKAQEPEFCPLFALNQKCHDITPLNCYGCNCPHFRFDDEAERIKSWCEVKSKQGKQYFFEEEIHQDCSGCTIPHRY
jgi:hypothetical protein